ncbi:MAG TPA: hypothetical protein VFU49_05370 [Ktedonobacteraceae bacterium]|nr:hypothetical protein [Ktedonobacteraceae bacterium]
MRKMQKPSISRAIEPDERLWNSTCRLVGHDWQSTTSESVRRCIRTGCQAVQRRKGEWWAYVSVKQKPPQATSHRPAVQQPPLFS